MSNTRMFPQSCSATTTLTIPAAHPHKLTSTSATQWCCYAASKQRTIEAASLNINKSYFQLHNHSTEKHISMSLKLLHSENNFQQACKSKGNYNAVTAYKKVSLIW